MADEPGPGWKTPNTHSSPAVRRLLRSYLREDLGPGDRTTELSIADANGPARGKIVSHGEYVAAGLEFAGPLLAELHQMMPGPVDGKDEAIREEPLISIHAGDGHPVHPDETLLDVRGPAVLLLVYERTALNLLARMTGIATLTARTLEKCREFNSEVTVAATRKTTPGFRFFEKSAVVAGGGSPHRFGLFDMVLIKDNHAAMAGGVERAVRNTMENLKRSGGGQCGDRADTKNGGEGPAQDRADPKRDGGVVTGPELLAALPCPKGGRRFPPGASGGRRLAVEVEVTTMSEAVNVAAMGVDAILLDNFTPGEAEAVYGKVKGVNAGVMVEVSGGVTPETAVLYANAADVISMGSLTHSCPAADLSMDVRVRN